MPHQNGSCSLGPKRLQHNTRESNILPDFEKECKPLLNLPPAGDKIIWKQVDNDLSGILSKTFPTYKVTHLSVSSVIDAMDECVYE